MNTRYVSTQTSIYSDPDLRPWHPLTIYFYRYLYENDHVHGITGIGQIALEIMRFESKLTTRQIERAKAEMGGKVLWFDENTYWVVGRAKHTCYTGNGTLHPKFAAGARNFLKSVATPIYRAFQAKYPELLADTSPPHQRPVANPSPIERQPITKPTLPTEPDAVTDADADPESERESPEILPRAREQRPLPPQEPESQNDDDGPPHVPEPAPESCVGQSLRLLVDQFAVQAGWTGSKKPIYEHLRPLLVTYGDGVISAAIREKVEPGMKPWALAELLPRHIKATASEARRFAAHMAYEEKRKAWEREAGEDDYQKGVKEIVKQLQAAEEQT